MGKLSQLSKRVADLSRRPLVRNALALYGVTIANAILPLVTVPFLARVLRPDGWGVVLFAQTVSVWLAMLVEYGFVYSATREIARNANDPEAVRQIVARVMGSKILLSGVAAVAAVVLGLTVPVFQQNFAFLMFALWLAVVQGMSPLWYFQGIERMALPALIDIGFRTVYTISLFFVIREPSDATRVLLYQALSITVATGISVYLMYRRAGFDLRGMGRAWAELRSAWHFFLFVAVINLYAKSNSFLLGVVVNPTVVGFYGGPERLMRGMLSFTGPINQVLYPRLSQLVKQDFQAARVTVRNASLSVAAFGLVLGLILTLGAPWLVLIFFGPGYEAAIPVLRVLGFVCPLSAVTSVMGIRWMFPLGMEHMFNRIAVGGALLDLTLAVPLAMWQQALGVACALLVTEAFILTTVFVYLWKVNLNPFQQHCIAPPHHGAAAKPAAAAPAPATTPEPGAAAAE